MALRNGVEKVQLPSGAVRYEVRHRVTGPDGKRKQVRRRFTTQKEAGEYLDSFQEQLRKEEASASADGPQTTVDEAVARWLAAQRINPTTEAAYSAALAPVVERFGDRAVCTVTDEEIQHLIKDLQAGKGPGGRKWKRTSINPLLARTKAVWADLERRGEIECDLIAHVKPLRKKDDVEAHDGALDLSDRLSDVEVKQLLAKHSATRFPVIGGVRSAEHQAVIHAPLVHLALIGLRRGELAGLRWSSVDLGAGTITAAARTRVRVTGRTIDQKHGKTATSARTLPLPASTLAILRGTRERQRTARKRAGESWAGARDLHVLTHVDGRPVAPRTLDDWWKLSLAHAGVTHRRLHAARHTAASRLAAAGVPPAQIAAWLGHADGGQLALRTYVHVEAPELGDLAKMLG
ncbi:tyrosine-type recombinase/integrase [Gordonia malaquae]|uniref:tyrosine-type recombinase/integrase n=1 Tax=Gordonia malaquae TaxID=410332 RepID=UPI0030FEA464